MKNYIASLLIVLLWASAFNHSHAQTAYFNQIMSSAAYSHPALVGFRETPVLGWQYNSNNSTWKSSSMSASIPFKKFGVHAAWMSNSGAGLNFNVLSLGVNKAFEVNKLKAVLAFGLEGSKTGYDENSLYFPDELHNRLGFVYDDPQGFDPKRQLAYTVSAAIDYKGLLLFATTSGRKLASSAELGAYPLTSFGLGHHFKKGNWMFQALGNYTIHGPWTRSDEMLTARYRFIEFGFGGQQVEGPTFFPKAQLGVVSKRFKVSYVYVNRSKAYSRVTSGFTRQEHEVSLVVGLHKKEQKTEFSLL